MPEILAVRRTYPTPTPETLSQRQDNFKSFVRGTCERYRQDDGINGARERDFLVSLKYLKDLNPVFYLNGFRCEDNKNEYLLTYDTNESLYIENLKTQAYMTGFVRQLQSLVKDLAHEAAEEGTATPGHCIACNEEHMTYGLELELNLLNGSDARDKFLALLNGKLECDLEHHDDDYGVDGSGRPLELRNINGRTIDETIANLEGRLTKFFVTLNALKTKYPKINTSLETRNCGIHVHYFHPGVFRGRVLTANAIVGMLVNSHNNVRWQERLNHGYGLPFGHRNVANDSRAWCTDRQHATELRIFNVVHPSVLRYALEQTERLINDRVPPIQAAFDRWCNAVHIRVADLVLPEKFNLAMAWLVHIGKAVKIEHLLEMNGWLKANYKNIEGISNSTGGLLDPDIIERLRPALVNANARTPYDPATADPNVLISPYYSEQQPSFNMGDYLQSTARREFQRLQSVSPTPREQAWDDAPYTSWCERLSRVATLRLGTAYRVLTSRARFSFNRHIESCITCRGRLATHRELGQMLSITERGDEGELAFVMRTPVIRTQRDADRIVEQATQDGEDTTNV